MEKLIVLIPAFNEEKNILKVIKELERDLNFADILVINDCSTDRTEHILIENNINHINAVYNSGYASSLQLGFKYALSRNYDYVIQFDGDGQHVALEAKKLYDKIIETSSDIVIGSRFLEKNAYKHGFFRKIGTNLFSRLIYAFTGESITDPTSGFQILNKKVYGFYSQKGNYPEFPDANLIILMIYRGFKVNEIPVIMREREFGVSMHSGLLKPLKYMIKMIYSIFLIFVGNFIFKRRK